MPILFFKFGLKTDLVSTTRGLNSVSDLYLKRQYILL